MTLPRKFSKDVQTFVIHKWIHSAPLYECFQKFGRLLMGSSCASTGHRVSRIVLSVEFQTNVFGSCTTFKVIPLALENDADDDDNDYDNVYMHLLGHAITPKR